MEEGGEVGEWATSREVWADAPLIAYSCLVPRHTLHFAPRHPLQLCGWNRVRNPALDDLEVAEDKLSRTIEREVRPASMAAANSLTG
jgi:hypothetical protein